MATMKEKTKLVYSTRADIAGASLTNAYQLLTTLSVAARYVKFVNTSNRDVDISTNGTNDHDLSRAGSTDPIPACGLRNTSEGTYFPAGTQFYVKAAAGAGTGTFSLVVIHT